jgi:hypothetical protein
MTNAANIQHDLTTAAGRAEYFRDVRRVRLELDLSAIAIDKYLSK